MAGILAHGVTAEIALTASTTKTLIQLVAAANHRIKVTSFGIFCKGVASTDNPVLVQVARQTTAGTMSALTCVKNNSADDETLQTTAQHTATVEPTLGDVLYSAEVHPQSGWEVLLPYGQEIIVPGGGRVAIKATPGAYPAAGLTVVAQLTFEE